MAKKRYESALVRLRKSKGFTQAELAYWSGVSRTAIVAIERGMSNPHLSTLRKIAEVLQCSIDDLEDAS